MKWLVFSVILIAWPIGYGVEAGWSFWSIFMCIMWAGLAAGVAAHLATDS